MASISWPSRCPPIHMDLCMAGTDSTWLNPTSTEKCSELSYPTGRPESYRPDSWTGGMICSASNKLNAAHDALRVSGFTSTSLGESSFELYARSLNALPERIKWRSLTEVSPKMVSASRWCVLAAFLISTSANSLKHSLVDVPLGWAELKDAQLSPTRGLTLRFGLAQHDFPQLESLLRNISDPSHPSYGNHLSKEQVHALSKPSNGTLELVEGWLATHNSSSVKWSSSHDSVTATIPISSAESMLSTRFGVFKHLKSGQRAIRTLNYSLPDAMLPHIDFVHPTTAFFNPARHSMNKLSSDEDGTSQSDFTSCVNVTDPPCVRKLYNIGNYTPRGSIKNNRIGVAGFLHVWARPDSFKLYLDDYIPESRRSDYTFDVVNITGPFIAASINAEGNLDTQLAIQVAYPIPMTYYTANSIPPYIPDQNQDSEGPGVNEPYLDFIDYLLGLDVPPTVVTISYGDDEQTVPRDYANAVCQGFAKLGARGVSVLFSSGDQGLGVNDLPTCIANTGNNATTFLPVFPASCPYVTSVGQTQGFFPQLPSSNSGAGFSYYFARPWYQDSAVSAYLDGPANIHETTLQSSMYNHQGRAYPDIVCAGSGAFFEFFDNKWTIGGGTSAAAPTAAGIVALLNDWRLRHGKPTMGFLNPFLYGVGLKGMVDIAEGLVKGCEQPGFNATQGWDPASGLGFFDFQKLQSLVL
ncbi:peptidase S8/S53 domain-containing protein [Mycena capillaripes]|nr:peptidase S8/S53 domain-containing protein [Mycena capillaripes]